MGNKWGIQNLQKDQIYFYHPIMSPTVSQTVKKKLSNLKLCTS